MIIFGYFGLKYSTTLFLNIYFHPKHDSYIQNMILLSKI